jgi:hypothetical protein
VLAGPVSPECFEPVARWHAQVVQGLSGIQHHQLPQGGSFDAWVDGLDPLS